MYLKIFKSFNLNVTFIINLLLFMIHFLTNLIIHNQVPQLHLLVHLTYLAQTSSVLTPIIASISDNFQQSLNRPRKQARLTDFVQQSRPLSVTKKKQFDEQLAKMIVKR